MRGVDCGRNKSKVYQALNRWMESRGSDNEASARLAPPVSLIRATSRPLASQQWTVLPKM